MSDRYLNNLLGEREQILRVAHQHWFLLAQAILPEALLIVGLLVLVSMLMAPTAGVAAIGYPLIILPLISLVRDYLIWLNHQYVVTSRRVIQLFGVFNKNVTDSSLEKVNDVKMTQSFWGRLFGFGDIQILTASEMGINRFTTIGDPVGFKTAMLNAKAKLESGEGAPPPAAQQAAVLANLEALHRAGILTDEEFAAKKKAALESK